MIYHLIMSNLIISLSIVLILIIRPVSGISYKQGRIIWLLMSVLLTAVFMPDLNIVMPVYKIMESGAKTASAFYSTTNSKDFYISVSSLNFLYYPWLAGVIISLIVFITGIIGLFMMPKTRFENSFFDKCCNAVGIKACLYKSSLIHTPISFGIIKRIVVLPEREYNSKELEFIFLHELFHHKHRDIIFNYYLNFIAALYWFNPFVGGVIKPLRHQKSYQRNKC